MKLKELVGERFKEKPSDCVVDSHALMLRGGYMKGVAAGIYSKYLPLTRICRKIENIIREEMDAIGGQEVLFPVALPACLWEQSGRYESVGGELLRFKDRNDVRMVLGMTHEEAAVQLVREYANSYVKYPFMIYQIQTKFRDEARPRAGLIRVREFRMKDAYSFHTSQEDMDRFYNICFGAYERIFARAGLPGVISVRSDSGMMGGSVSHEFMLLTPIGEDSIAVCSSCDYRANLEAAENLVKNERDGESEPLTEVRTPGLRSIAEVCDFLHTDLKKSCKAVVYQKNAADEYVVVFLRGDLDVNEAKLTALLGGAVHPAAITPESGLCAGFVGPYKLNRDCVAVYDSSLKNTNNLVCGGNREDVHFTGLDLVRDIGEVSYVDVAKLKDGGLCPSCGKPSIRILRGIEVGNIFELGTKYTEAMDMTYLDRDGGARYPLMGCYGIGVGRLAASVCEAHHDEYGPVWPVSVAPWQVHLFCLRSDDDRTKAFADSLYDKLQAEKLEVLYDDRNVRPGVMFSDADLLGAPVRLLVSPRNMAEGCCELLTRDRTVNKKVPLTDVISETKALLAELSEKIQAGCPARSEASEIRKKGKEG